MIKLTDVIEFHKKGGLVPNFKELERTYGIDARTIKKYYYNGFPQKITRQRATELDDYHDLIVAKLAIPGITYVGIHDLLKHKYGVLTSYSNFRYYLKKHKLSKGYNTVVSTIRYETAQGVQAQIDWKENFQLVDGFGDLIKVNVFVMVMSYSRKHYSEITLDRSQETLFKCIRNALVFFDGVPKRILFDNMATVIDRTAKDEKKKINKKMKQFAADVGFEVCTTSIRNPMAKGKVETKMKFIDRLKAYNDEFVGFDEISTISDKLRDRINSEVSQATNMIPNLLFIKEKEYLKPLNEIVLQKYNVRPKTYHVSNEGLISYKGSKYSVPVDYMFKSVRVDLVDDNLHIYYNKELLAIHKKTKNKINYLKEHYQELAEIHLEAIEFSDKENRFDIDDNLMAFDKIMGD